jgi:hypothetical protein
MKRTVIYWKTFDVERKKEVKAALGITSVSVNGESDYNGDPERLVPYVEEGLITIRTKEYEQEIRRKKVCFDPIESKPVNRKKVGRGSRTRKV